MNAEQERKRAMSRDIPAAKEAEMNASAREQMAQRRLEIIEGDHYDRKRLNEERIAAMRQAREMQKFAFYRVMLPLLGASVLALAGLGVAVACFDFVATPQGSEYGGARPSPWPKVVFISGTFLTFIFVFGAFVKGVFASSRGGEDASNNNLAMGLAEKTARSSGE